MVSSFGFFRQFLHTFVDTLSTLRDYKSKPLIVFLAPHYNGGQSKKKELVPLLSFLRVSAMSLFISDSGVSTTSETQVRCERRVQDTASCRYALCKRRDYTVSRCSSNPNGSLLRPQHHRLLVPTHRRREA